MVMGLGILLSVKESDQTQELVWWCSLENVWDAAHVDSDWLIACSHAFCLWQHTFSNVFHTSQVFSFCLDLCMARYPLCPFPKIVIPYIHNSYKIYIKFTMPASACSNIFVHIQQLWKLVAKNPGHMNGENTVGFPRHCLLTPETSWMRPSVFRL